MQRPISAETGDDKEKKRGVYLAEPNITRIRASSTRISCSIHRVPRRIRNEHDEVFTPQIISIGPFHHDKRGYHDQQGDPYIKAMEEHKRKYLCDLIHRKGDCLENCRRAVEGVEQRARECYSEEFKNINRESFVDMMVLDGCFILELFCRTWMAGVDAKHEDDPLVKLEWLRKQIAIDLLVLENQIPFFVLQNLFDVLNISGATLPEMAITFFRSVLQTINNNMSDFTLPHFDVQHLLHLVHSSLLNHYGENQAMNWTKHRQVYNVKMIPCASELVAVGFKFKTREVRHQKGRNEGFLGIKFKRNRGPVNCGVIEIPRVKVSDVTQTLLLNLVAFEQCYRHCTTDFSGYIVILDCLISNADDAGILCNNGIHNSMGSNEHLVNLVNNIGGRLTIDDCKLHETFEQINGRYEEVTKWALRESFSRNYVKNPFAVISIIIAVTSFLTSIFFQLLNMIRSSK